MRQPCKAARPQTAIERRSHDPDCPPHARSHPPIFVGHVRQGQQPTDGPGIGLSTQVGRRCAGQSGPGHRPGLVARLSPRATVKRRLFRAGSNTINGTPFASLAPPSHELSVTHRWPQLLAMPVFWRQLYPGDTLCLPRHGLPNQSAALHRSAAGRWSVLSFFSSQELHPDSFKHLSLHMDALFSLRQTPCQEPC